MDGSRLAANRRTWDAIAASFDATRRRPWSGVAAFVATIAPGSCIVDVGSGNGRHAEVAAAAGLRVVLVDVSGRLLRTASARVGSARPVQAAAEVLPFRDGVFDAALFVAALHHVAPRAARVGALADLRRVVRPGGRALVSVWARPETARTKAWRPVEGPDAEPGDVWVPWRTGTEHVDRFYHMYDADELTEDARAAGLAVDGAKAVAWSGPEADNHVAWVHRPG